MVSERDAVPFDVDEEGVGGVEERDGFVVDLAGRGEDGGGAAEPDGAAERVRKGGGQDVAVDVVADFGGELEEWAGLGGGHCGLSASVGHLRLEGGRYFLTYAGKGSWIRMVNVLG